jgi:hypothetical protein
MYKKINSQLPLTLVTIDEVKAQCRVFNTFEDNYLTSLIEPYSDLAQGYTNRMLTAGEAVVFVEEYCPKFQLPFGEVTSISEVLVDGVTTTEFEFNPITQKIKINLVFKEVQVTFTAGYITLPKIVKQAVLIAINNAFVNRGEVVIGQTVSKLPTTSENLLDRVKFHGA